MGIRDDVGSFKDVGGMFERLSFLVAENAGFAAREGIPKREREREGLMCVLPQPLPGCAESLLMKCRSGICHRQRLGCGQR
jgi:hypothetical protein